MPSLPVLRAIAWRRLAAARARIAPAPRVGLQPPDEQGTRPPKAVAEGGVDWLTPILVDYFGRDGSTALMKLLGSSPSILVEGRYPFESNRLARVLAAAGLRGTGMPLRSRPPSSNLQPESGASAESRWSESSRELSRGPEAGVATHYAEKLMDASAIDRGPLPGALLVVLSRDPRDVLVSIEAFSRAVGDEIGGAGDREERLARFVARQRRRLRRLAELSSDERTMIVDYRELVDDLDGVAGRLGRWLGVELDPTGVGRDFRLRWIHGTSRDPRSSVGRWRRELDGPTIELLEREIGPEMRALGFD